MLFIYCPLCYIVKKYHRNILGSDATVLLGHKQKLSGKHARNGTKLEDQQVRLKSRNYWLLPIKI